MKQYCNRREFFVADNPVSNQSPLPVSSSQITAGSQSVFVKTSVNTAGFGELAAAYLAAMSEGEAATPYDIPVGAQAAPVGRSHVRLYRDALQSARGRRPGTGAGCRHTAAEPRFLQRAADDQNPRRMFRNTLRDNTQAATTVGDRTVNYNYGTNQMTGTTDSSRSLHFQPQYMKRLALSGGS